LNLKRLESGKTQRIDPIDFFADHGACDSVALFRGGDNAANVSAGK